MQFIVIAYDGTDEKALERRMAARDTHLVDAKAFFESGRWLYAVGILNDDGVMIGSMIVCDFESREAVDEEWLRDEPYVTGEVWEKIDVHCAAVAPFLLNK